MKRSLVVLIFMSLFLLLWVHAYADLSAGLEAYYPFNGNALDASGNGRHGTLTGDSTEPTLVPDKDGTADSAYDFDGIDDRIDTADFDLPDTFSISMRVDPDDPSGKDIILSKNDIGGNTIFLFGFVGNEYVVEIRDTCRLPTAPISGWHHLAVVVENDGAASDITLYRNGSVLWTDQIAAVAGDMTGKAWSIGHHWVGDTARDHFDGRIEEVRIYSRALGPEEIMILSGRHEVSHSLDPPYVPDDPGSAMYRLEDVYNYLDTGVAGLKRAGGFTEPSSGPGITGVTVDKIHKKVTERCITCESGELSPLGRWCDQGDGTVKDMTTGLVWLKDASWGGQKPWRDSSSQYEWDDAHTRAGLLNAGDSTAGLSDGSVAGDWRLPTKAELVGITTNTGNEYVRHSSQYFFTGVYYDFYYWSSTTMSSDLPYNAASVNPFCYVFYHNKGSSHNVWPVRSDN